MNKKLTILFSIVPGLGLIYIGVYNWGVGIFLIFNILIFILNYVLGQNYFLLMGGLAITLIVYLVSIIFTIRKASANVTSKKSNLIYFLIFLLSVVIIFSNREISGNISRYKHWKTTSETMSPYINYEDMLIIDTFYFSNNELKRGDIISYYEPMDNYYIIRKCVAIYGDRVEIIDGSVYINNQLYLEYKLEDNVDQWKLENMFNLKPIYVDKGTFFSLAEKFSNSIDSRIHGAVNINDIHGKVLYSYLPEYKKFD